MGAPEGWVGVGAGDTAWDPGGAPFDWLRASGLIPVMLSLP
jgi:hypothetical protein